MLPDPEAAIEAAIGCIQMKCKRALTSQDFNIT